MRYFPGSTWVGSQSTLGAASTGWSRPSCRCSAEPGQRLRWLSAAPALEGLVAQLGRHRRELAVGERERARVDADARGGAERVVDAGVAEVVEPAERVGRVGAHGGELGHVVAQRLGDGRERALALGAVRLDLAHRRVAQRHLQACVSSSASLSAPGRRRISDEVAQRRPRVARQRAQLGQERAQLLGHRLGVLDQRVEVVERGAQVEEGRVGAAHERRQLLDRVGQRGLLGADRGRRGGEVVDQARRGRRGGRRRR